MKKILTVLFAALLAATGCSIVETQPDEVALHYDGGPLVPERFKNCVDSSTRNIDNVFDNHYKYPAGQRTWDFTGARDEDGLIVESEPIAITDADGTSLDVPGIVTYTLNVECGTAREFHDRIGLKYEAYDDGDGWDNMLEAYIGNPLAKALDQATKGYTWRDLLFDEEQRLAWEDRVGELAQRYVLNQSGGDYFCQPTFVGDEDCGGFALTLQEPDLPPGVREALNETAAEQERLTQAESIQDRIDTEAETLQSLVDVLGPEGALLYQAIQDGRINAVPVPVGSDVIVDGSGNTNLPPVEDETDDE